MELTMKRTPRLVKELSLKYILKPWMSASAFHLAPRARGDQDNWSTRQSLSETLSDVGTDSITFLELEIHFVNEIPIWKAVLIPVILRNRLRVPTASSRHVFCRVLYIIKPKLVQSGTQQIKQHLVIFWIPIEIVSWLPYEAEGWEG